MTTAPAAPAAVPLFLDGSAGRLFAIYHPPAVSRAAPGVLYVPPFAEEMNRARRMAAEQARALSVAGFGVLLLDLYGTGDSAGDFGDATWEQWLDDIATGAGELARRGHGGCCLLALRSGALLASAAAARGEMAIRRMVLWQPALSGKTLLTQFLRIRVAAGMAEGGEAGSTGEARALLAKGEPVEVAGYEVSPALAASLDGARLDAAAPAMPVDWIEIVSDAGAGLPPAAARVAEAWRSEGARLRLHTVTGQPFWSIQETVAVPALVEKTVEVLSDDRA